MTIEDIEVAVAKLPPDQFARFAAWFADYQAEMWDRQIEDDLRAGRLDAVMQRAREDIAGSIPVSPEALR
jgi:hypothetical protein